MKLVIVWLQARAGREKVPGVGAFTEEFLGRIGRYAPVETHALNDEAALFSMLERTSQRTRPALVLLDSRGKQLTSEGFADFFQGHMDRGTQTLVFVIGGPDGFSPAAHKQAQAVLSFGKMTMAHEVARLVLLEQIYRAYTILKGHPYHKGH